MTELGSGDTLAGLPSATGSRRPISTPRPRAKDSQLLALFDRAGRNVQQTGDVLERLLADWPDSRGLRKEMLDCEHKGDRITRDLIHLLHTTEPRQFDREDLFGLAASLDDVVDYAEEVADYLGLYQIEAPMDEAQQLAAVLRAACGRLATAMNGLDDPGGLASELVEIKRLEHDGDRIVRGAIASLFVGGIDPTIIIRWKDLFERLEDAIDSCKRAAQIVEGIAAKRA